MQPEFVNERRKQLQKYLDELLAIPEIACYQARACTPASIRSFPSSTCGGSRRVCVCVGGGGFLEHGIRMRD